MKKIIYFLIPVIFILSGKESFGQRKDSTWVGSVSGVLWDSAHNAILRSATLAIYRAADAELISYRLTNNYGEFSFDQLPMDIPLKIVASFVGYKSCQKIFFIPSSQKKSDLGHLSLIVDTGELLAAVVTSTPPPVRMKGDTLEFNADAFKLDPNAQTEDLLRVLPGVVVWADGTITVNGREVTTVLVNGKPFFGGDARVATQNIPKNIVDKIQVYQKEKDRQRPADSTTEINIKLKKGREYGYFGKFSGGYGTGGHYESDGSLNFFNDRSQLGLAFSSNNVNKVANDINFILRNNTFKGTGANVEYQSNFTIEGINKYTAAGMLFQHDFIPHPDYYNNDRFTALYFLKNNRQDLQQNTETITTLNDKNYYLQQNRNHNITSQTSQNGTATYEKIKDGNTFTIDGNFRNESSKSTGGTQSSVLDENEDLLSTNSVSTSTASEGNTGSLRVAYKQKPLTQGNSWYSPYEGSYKLTLADTRNMLAYQSDYATPGDSTNNRYLDRIYRTTYTKVVNDLLFKLPNFGALIFGNYKLAGIVTGWQTEGQITTDKENNQVSQRDTPTKAYQADTYLTNNRREVIVDVKPALTFSKNRYKSLSGRYAKSFSAQLNVVDQFYELNSSSAKAFQQFSKYYQKFVPNANISWSNRQFGEFTDNVSLLISTSAQYPMVQQLTPLVDSANLNFIQTGNPYLKAEDKREVTFSFRHISERSTNILTWSLIFNAGFIHNYFTSSSTIDSLGRTVYTTVNANGYRYLSGSADIKKAFKLMTGQFQLSISPMVSLNRSPNYLNGILNYFSNFSLTYDPGISYTYKDLLAVSFLQKQNYSRYKQNGTGAADLTSRISQSALSFSLNCTRKLTVASNAIYTNNTSTGSAAQSFTIWNASAACKLFKGNTAEIKLSALDILHENKGLTNFGLNNSITHGTVNVLQQYFMVTLAWFPRKFGK